MEEFIVVAGARILIGGLLFLAGLQKLRRPAEFRRIVLENFGLRPQYLAVLVSVAVPVAEVTLGTLLLLGLYVHLTAWVTGAFLVLLTAAAAGFLKDGADCGCGTGLLPGRRWLLGRNLVLIGVAWSLPVLSGASALGGAAALSIGLAILAAAYLLRRPAGDFSPPPAAINRVSRRSFLQMVAVGAGVAFAAVLPATRPAEAACYGCRTCSPESIFYGCSGGCCTFLVRDREYCDSGCSPCSGWRQETYC